MTSSTVFVVIDNLSQAHAVYDDLEKAIEVAKTVASKPEAKTYLQINEVRTNHINMGEPYDIKWTSESIGVDVCWPKRELGGMAVPPPSPHPLPLQLAIQQHCELTNPTTPPAANKKRVSPAVPRAPRKKRTPKASESKEK